MKLSEFVCSEAVIPHLQASDRDGVIAELISALAEAGKADSGVYIEIIVDPWLCPQGGGFLFTGTGALFGKPTRTWEGWLKEMAAKTKA